MKLLKTNIQHTAEIKKSRFLTYIYQVANEEEVKSYLAEIKKNNPGAKHVIYAYITSDLKMGASEDKEPINSAHRILNNLKSKGVAGLACFVVRYFGGTLLGASNLDRTYVSCVFDSLKDECFGEKIDLGVYEGNISNNYLSTFEEEINKLGGEVLEKIYLGPIVKVTFSLQKNSFSKTIYSYLTDVVKTDRNISVIV